MVLFLYRVLTYVALVAAIPVVLLMSLRDARFRYRLADRAGFHAPSPRHRPVLWFHTASVGEFLMAMPLIKEIRQRRTDLEIIISTQTPSGHQTVVEKLGRDVRACLIPADTPDAAARAVKRLNPALVILFETEIWPNLILALQKRQVPLVLLNGRISPRSFRRYRCARPLLKKVWSAFSLVAVQSADDGRRFELLGCPHEKIVLSGNLKYDRYIPPLSTELRLLVEQHLLRHGQRPLFILGSLHRGEFEQVARCVRLLRERHESLACLWAARHLEDVSRSEYALTQEGLTFRRRSTLTPLPADETGTTHPDIDVLILDSYGELSSLYELGTIVFVGGSLCAAGGQNMLEPAYFSKPVLFGPHTENFEDIARHFLEGGGAIRVSDDAELLRVADRLLGDPQERTELGRRAAGLLDVHRGALSRTLDMLGPFLENVRGDHDA